MRRLSVILVFIANIVSAQDKVITLDACYSNMLLTYPTSSKKNIYEKSNDLSIKNINSGWLPSPDLSLQATYQSDAIEVGFNVMGNNMGFKGEKDQYKATVNINQLLYDWGRIKSARQLESVNLKVNQQGVEVELNKIKDQINKFFFAILVLQRNEELFTVMQSDLEAKEKTVEAGVKNGVLLESDLNVIKAEKIKLEQSIIEIKEQRFAAIDALAEITGLEIGYADTFQAPEIQIDYDNALNRPEQLLFNYQMEKLDATSKLISKQNTPTLFAFSQLGYGKPGLNMVNDEFDSFYIVGVGLNWKLWDWNKTKREEQILMLNKDVISLQKNDFTKQMNVAIRNEKAKIKMYKEALENDLEVIKLREEVTESARSKLDNGVITSTEYITELTKETQAKLNYETHKIQLVQFKTNYLFLKGEL